MTTTLEDLQKNLDASPFIHFCGMTVTEADPEAQTLTLRMPMRPEFERIAGSKQCHGRPIASLIDTAACYVVTMGVGHGVPTIDCRIDYLRPAIDTDLIAKVAVRRVGRSIGVADVDVLNEEGKLLATGRATFSRSAG